MKKRIQFENLASYGDQRVAVVIMARNEERTIAEVVESAKPFAHDIIVMDGRSTDSTASEARRAGATVYADPGMGKGAATRMAIGVLEHDVLVFMDADGSHDPEDIPVLAMPIVRGEVELCVGSRFLGGSEELSISFGQLIRTIGNILMNIAINKRWKVELSDTLNGFRAVRRAALARVMLKENRHTIEQEMIMKMLRYGFRVKNVPTHEYARKYGTSSINIWREWHLFAWCVFVNIVYPGPAITPLPVPETDLSKDDKSSAAQESM